MAFTSRVFNPGQKPSEVFSQNAGASRLHRYFYLRVGRVVEIDYDKYKFKVEWMDGAGSSPWIPISFPYVGPASCMGAVPEIGALAICGFSNPGTGGTPMPFCLSFVPTNLEAALDYNSAKRLPDSIPTEEDNLLFLKFRKLQKGDLVMSSLWGGEIFINSDIEIKDKFSDSIQVRSSDQSIISTSLNNFIFNTGISVHSGSVIRNKIPIFDSDGNRIPNQLARELSLTDGRDNIYLVPHGKKIEEDALFYTEYRIDVDDIASSKQNINDINSQSSSGKNAIVSMVLGNYAGSMDTDNRYGKMLRPVLFGSTIDRVGQFDLIECVQNKGVDEVEKIGIAYAIHLLKNNSFMGFDKEGHFYLNMNASSAANPLGAGRSMSVLGNGNLKEVWGQTAEDGNSWDLSTTGGIRWNIGQHNDAGKNRSIEIKTNSGIKIEVRNNDADELAKQELIYGNTKTSIEGSENVEVRGQSDLIIHGLRHEQVYGASSYDYHASKTENCMEVYTQTVVKEMQGNYGMRKDKVLLGQELTVMKGNIEENIKTFGSKRTTLTKGNIEETIILGNRRTDIIAGNYKLDIKKGNVTLGTWVGNVDIESKTGKVSLKGLVSADVNALKVNLGKLPVRGGVVTGLPGVPSTFCYITGLAPRGSTTVKASI